MLWILTLASLIATILNVQKKRLCFFIWIFTNTAWMITDFKKGLPEQAGLFAVYVVMAIWGLFKWKN
jgi:nicotinamide riboside transporter PnuC